MKNFLIILAISLFWSNVSIANYNCSYNVWFKIGPEGELQKKVIKMTVSFKDEKTLRIFDHEIDSYYSDEFFVLENNNKTIQGIFSDSKKIRSFILDKQTRYSQWTSVWGKGSTTIHYGYCK